MVIFTASVTSGATGNVAFRDNGVDIPGCGSIVLEASGAMCTTSSLSPGSHSITAIYSGDANYNGSASSAHSQMVAVVLRTSGAQVGGYYSSIQDAYDAANNGDLIRMINVGFSEVLYFDREDNITVLLQGGVTRTSSL